MYNNKFFINLIILISVHFCYNSVLNAKANNHLGSNENLDSLVSNPQIYKANIDYGQIGTLVRV